MAKRRTKKRTTRRGGRVMTVTTTSRVIKTTHVNPEQKISGSKRIAEAMSAWYESGSDPVYAVSSHWYGGHAVDRSAVEGALANIRRSIKVFDDPIKRDSNGWTNADLRQLRSIERYLMKQLGAKSNPSDPRTAETQRIPVIRATIPAGTGKDPRTAETRRLKVVTSAHRKNPVRKIVVPRTMWKRLKRADKRPGYVRCAVRSGRRTFWLPCTIR